MLLVSDRAGKIAELSITDLPQIKCGNGNIFNRGKGNILRLNSVLECSTDISCSLQLQSFKNV